MGANTTGDGMCGAKVGIDRAGTTTSGETSHMMEGQMHQVVHPMATLTRASGMVALASSEMVVEGVATEELQAIVIETGTRRQCIMFSQYMGNCLFFVNKKTFI